MSDKYAIPQHLDEPFKLMLWTVDELMVLFTPLLVLLLVFNSPIIGFLMGGSLMLIVKKMKGEQGHYFLYNLMYWYLPAVLHFRQIPPSYIREWIG